MIHSVMILKPFGTRKFPTPSAVVVVVTESEVTQREMSIKSHSPLQCSFDIGCVA